MELSHNQKIEVAKTVLEYLRNSATTSKSDTEIYEHLNVRTTIELTQLRDVLDGLVKEGSVERRHDPYETYRSKTKA